MNRVSCGSQYTTFRTLNYGDIFDYNYCICMKIKDDEDEYSVYGKAVRLESGIVELVNRDENVLKINKVELEVEE